MNKFTFTVDLVGKDIDTSTICDMLKAAVDGVTEHECVAHTNTKELTEQGFKVWAKRKCGISYANKPQKKVQVEA
jgi:hypothetical protein